MTEHDGERALLERKAALARSRLLSTLDALDHRRQNIVAVAGEVKRAAATTALALATATATAAAYFLFRRTRRRAATWERPPRAPALAGAFETLAVVGIAYGVRQLVRAASRKPARQPPRFRSTPPRRESKRTAARPE